MSKIILKKLNYCKNKLPLMKFKLNAKLKKIATLNITYS